MLFSLLWLCLFMLCVCVCVWIVRKNAGFPKSSFFKIHFFCPHKDDGGPFRNQDETIEFVLNLNLDPQKPGQALRGALTLPHGTGKTSRCVVFTESTEMAERALEMGAIHAGGEALVDSIVSGDVPLVDFDRSLASQDIMGYLSRKLARTLGPRGLMPNAKVGSLVTSPNMLETALRDAMGGQAQYRTDREGILHWGIGKGSFGHEKLLDNMRAIMEEVYAIKPETYGKGKKASKNAIYFLRAHLTATQGSSIRIDRRTIDPSSKFYFDVAPA
mmetsp:Transcript_10891/g.25254  ORF Transcript_10891/g.25254 Transcript_10891/m.25254 type:complete len:273 (-) Transcript_10891:536-1354(-)